MRDVGGHAWGVHIEVTRGRVGLEAWYDWMETSFDFSGRRRRWDLLNVADVCGVAMVARLERVVGGVSSSADGVKGGEDVCIVPCGACQGRMVVVGVGSRVRGPLRGR